MHTTVLHIRTAGGAGKSGSVFGWTDRILAASGQYRLCWCAPELGSCGTRGALEAAAGAAWADAGELYIIGVNSAPDVTACAWSARIPLPGIELFLQSSSQQWSTRNGL